MNLLNYFNQGELHGFIYINFFSVFTYIFEIILQLNDFHLFSNIKSSIHNILLGIIIFI